MGHDAVGGRLQEEIDGLVEKNRDLFSAVVGLTTSEGDYWAAAAGAAGAGKGAEMTVDTPIFVASITKMYTATAAMMLEERGLLSLHDPLSRYFPAEMLAGLHRYKGRDYSDQLRVYHLVSQTSGLPDYFEASPKGGSSLFDRLVSEGDTAWDLQYVVDVAKNQLSPKFAPEPLGRETSGGKAHYADTNYQLLGAVIEAVMERSLQKAFEELILGPLALSATYLHGYRQPASPVEGAPSTIYYGEKPLFLNQAMTSFGPDGGLVSNIEDSLRFLRAMMEGNLFQNPATLQRMKSWRRIFFPMQYGLGLMRFKLPRILSPFSPAPELVGHSGVSSAFLFYNADAQLYIAGTLNQLKNQSRPFQLMLKLMNVVRAAGS
jgi:CubicO group peptidase (beta-lactamase class C family)